MVIAGALLFQMGWVTPSESPEDPFTRATTPPAQFLMFNADFSSLDLDQFFQWINPSRGLVTNGVLLTKEEAEEQFRSIFEGENIENLAEINLRYNWGQFQGANTYQADAWMEIKLAQAGDEDWYRMHHQFVFEIIANTWYLVQWEYIPPDLGLALGFQSGLSETEQVPEEYQRFAVPQSAATLSGVSVWPLLIGTNFATEAGLHPIRGTTPSGRTWSLAHAVSVGKPTVFYFFSVQGLSVALPEDFETQMQFLEGLYDRFGHENLYVYGVTDDDREELEWLGESGYTSFAPLLDENSDIHAALNIDTHPFIVVLDSEGTVVALSKTFHPSSYDLITARIQDAMASAG